MFGRSGVAGRKDTSAPAESGPALSWKVGKGSSNRLIKLALYVAACGDEERCETSEGPPIARSSLRLSCCAWRSFIVDVSVSRKRKREKETIFCCWKWRREEEEEEEAGGRGGWRRLELIVL